MTTTETADLTAADVAWDLEPLVDGRGVAGVDAAARRRRRARGEASRPAAATSPSSTPPAWPR